MKKQNNENERTPALAPTAVKVRTSDRVRLRANFSHSAWQKKARYSVIAHRRRAKRDREELTELSEAQPQAKAGRR